MLYSIAAVYIAALYMYITCNIANVIKHWPYTKPCLPLEMNLFGVDVGNWEKLLKLKEKVRWSRPIVLTCKP